MQQFVVPQFIEVEDRIIGPITVRQFIIMVVCGLIMFIEYKLSDMAMFLAIGIPTVVIFGIVAFLRVNSMPFHYFFLNLVETLKKPKIRVWSREIMFSIKKSEIDQKKDTAVVSVIPKKIATGSKLADLSLIIDTGGMYRGEEVNLDLSFNNHSQENK